MKQSFLDSLKGLFQDEAEALVETEDLTPLLVPPGCMIEHMLRPATVILWQDYDSTIDYAEAGDASEIEG